jgi:hypothetical protein
MRRDHTSTTFILHIGTDGGYRAQYQTTCKMRTGHAWCLRTGQLLQGWAYARVLATIDTTQTYKSSQIKIFELLMHL